MSYFIQDEATKLIKIGFTAGTGESRLRELQTGCPGKLVLLLEVAGEKADETAWHQRSAAARERGEWFRPIPELLLTIAEGKIVLLEEEKAQLRQRLETVQGRLGVVRGQLGSSWASMGGRPLPMKRGGFGPTSGSPMEQENEYLHAEIEEERRSRKSLQSALRNILDRINEPTEQRPVIYGHAEDPEG